MKTFKYSPPLPPPQPMCMFSLGDFLYLFFFFFAGGGRGVWVATKWDFFVGGGGGHVWSTLRLRLRLGNSLGGWVYSSLNVFGACLIHIF